MLLGQGITEFQESVQAIKEIGYAGWIISENFYCRPNLMTDGEDPVSLAKKMWKHSNRLLERRNPK